MKKILLLTMCIFIITGCKVEYNLVINNDLTIFESVQMTGTDEFFDNYYKSSHLNVINMMFDEYRKNELRENGYQYELVNVATPYVLASKKYGSCQEFVNNTIFFAQYFEDINVYEQSGIVNLSTKGFIPINPDSIERYNIKITTIAITSSYQVTSHNATSYDEKTNTYTWHIENDNKNFSLNISYDTNQIYKAPVDRTNLHLIIGTFVIVGGVIIFAYYMNRKNKK